MNDSPFIPRVCEIQLCGRTYKLDEPVRKKSRIMLADAFRIFSKHNIELSADGTFRVPNDIALLFVNDVLDWLYLHIDGMANDATVLDNADDEEIVNAFSQVMEFLVRPFKRQKEGTP